MRVDLTLALRYNCKTRNPVESANDIYTKNCEREGFAISVLPENEQIVRQTGFLI